MSKIEVCIHLSSLALSNNIFNDNAYLANVSITSGVDQRYDLNQTWSTFDRWSDSYPFPGVGMVSYIVEEAPHDLTLVDTTFQVDPLSNTDLYSR
jgi:hypothetical protein